MPLTPISTHSVVKAIYKQEISAAETVRGADFRKALSLRSTYFTWEADGDRIVFHTVGYGHGVGLSQAGAQAMAADGADFAEILAHYYPGTQLTWMDKTGFSGS